MKETYLTQTEQEAKLLEQAKMYAVRNHGLQEYDGFPYHKHLDDVDSVVQRYSNATKYRMAAWLHDIIEDTPVSYNDIDKQFGFEVAEIVFCVTDEMGRNRAEKKPKTYPKIKSNSDAVFIKLCDRIANVENGVKNGSSMIKKYVKEHKEFKEALWVDGVWNKVWSDLDLLMDTVKESLLLKM